MSTTLDPEGYAICAGCSAPCDPDDGCECGPACPVVVDPAYTTPRSRAAGVNDANTGTKDGHDGESLPLAGPASAAPLVVGLDLSLAATGIAHMCGERIVTDTITPPKNATGLLRLRWLRTEIVDLIGHPDLLVVEGPSYGSIGGRQHDRAGLFWMVLDKLWDRGVPVAVAPPSNIKQYATGSGGGPKSSKDAVLLVAEKRYPGVVAGNDEADALWAAAMGTDYLTGRSVVPAAHRAALVKVAWPTVSRAA